MFIKALLKAPQGKTCCHLRVWFPAKFWDLFLSRWWISGLACIQVSKVDYQVSCMKNKQPLMRWCLAHDAFIGRQCLSHNDISTPVNKSLPPLSPDVPRSEPLVRHICRILQYIDILCHISSSDKYQELLQLPEDELSRFSQLVRPPELTYVLKCEDLCEDFKEDLDFHFNLFGLRSLLVSFNAHTHTSHMHAHTLL